MTQLIKTLLLLIYFLGTGITVRASTVTVSANSDIGPCICDQTYNQCDPFCCCDADCASSVISDVQALGQCKANGPLDTKITGLSCYSKNYVQEVNPRYVYLF